VTPTAESETTNLGPFKTRPPRDSDRRLLYATVFIRALSIGLVGVLLGFHLKGRGFDDAEISLVVSAGLWGMAAATVAVGLWADRVGRRRSLIALALLAAAGVVAASLASHLLLACGAAFIGMLNGAGRERGALPALEQTLLAGTTDDAGRTRTFAVYSLLDDGGLAIGAALVWVIGRLAVRDTPPASLQAGGIAGAAALLLVAAALYTRLSPTTANVAPRERRRLSPLTRQRVAKISALFFLDGFGGGLVVGALLALFFQERFEVSPETVALLFFGARILNSISHLGAAWLAKRIGLVNTMVFTHIPSNVLLFTVTIVPSFAVAALLFLLREGLVEMDVPTRQSYVMAIVEPHERTAVNAITNLVRIVSWALAAAVAGRLMRDVAIQLPLAIAAGMKITYDVLLYRAFKSVRPPEEVGPRAA
jgi:MFS family permease